jgi:hypothetical protein
MVLSTVHLGVLIGEKIWKPHRMLVGVRGLLDIFGYFLLVLIGMELLETLKAYPEKARHSCARGAGSSAYRYGTQGHH